jgi:hypothetical protein
VEVPIPKQDFYSGYDATKAHFDQHARAVALARVANTKAKELGILGRRNTTERTQRHLLPASQSSRPVGKFEDPSYEFSQTAGGLRGGTGAITKDGRAWVIKRLKERIAELDAIDSSNYSNGPPPHQYVLPQFNELDTTLQVLIDAVATAAISGSLAETVTKVQVALLKVAPELTSDDILKYAEIVRDLKRACASLIDERGTAIAADKKRVIKVVQRGLVRIDELLVRINGANGNPDVLTKLVLPLQNEIFKNSKFDVARPGAEAAQEGAATKRANAEARRQLRERINREVQGFSPDQRASIRQRVQAGETTEDIADELDVLLDTIVRIVA